jgi:hypothetical protein
MKWKKSNGTVIETNDRPETLSYCKELGWQEIKGSKKVKLYQRLKGEIVEGDENPPEEVIIESESFPESFVDEAIKSGWFKTEEEAAHAPPDPKPKNKPGPKPKPKPDEGAGK